MSIKRNLTMGKFREHQEKGVTALKTVSIVAAVLAASVLVAYIILSGPAGNYNGRKSSGGVPSTPLREVAVITVEPEPVLLTTELPGRVVASLVAEVRPQVSGIIKERLFTEGSYVQTGQVLYRIDPAPFQVAVQNAEANLAAARQNLKRARAVTEAGMARVEQQRAVLDLARTNRDRLEGLAREGAATDRERDEAVNAAEVAAATLRSLEAQVTSDEGAVDVAEANIKQAEAALKAARINLGYASITAPIPGRIGRSSVTVGALVTAHQPLPLAIIQQMDPMFVDVSQSTAELLSLRRRFESGQLTQEEVDRKKAKLILEDGTEYAQPGELKFRDVTVDPSTGSVTLRIVFPNPEGILLPGMFVQAVVTEGVSERAILVPQQAVSRDPRGNPLTLVVDTEGVVARKMLSLDRAVGDRWLVSAGLAVGDQIIVEGMQWVRPGSAVKVVPYEKGKSDVPGTGHASKDGSQPE
jgi:membrane fusion protein (multidrug efflux system)